MRHFATFPAWVVPGIDLFVVGRSSDGQKVRSARRVTVRTLSIKGTMINGSMRALETTVAKIDDPEVLAFLAEQESEERARAEAGRPFEVHEVKTAEGKSVRIERFRDGKAVFSRRDISVALTGKSIDLGRDSLAFDDALTLSAILEAVGGYPENLKS